MDWTLHMQELVQVLAKQHLEIESNPIRSLETTKSKANLSYVSSPLSVLEYTSEPLSVCEDSPLPSPTTGCRTAALLQEKQQPRPLVLKAVTPVPLPEAKDKWSAKKLLGLGRCRVSASRSQDSTA